MKEFKACFQITKLVVFSVSYSTLGSNSNPYFSTSAGLLYKNKRDYGQCGQCQDSVLPKGGLAYKFYKKWDGKHLKVLTSEELEELYNDVEILKERYNHLYVEAEKFGNEYYRDFSFYEITELSKLDLNK